MNKKNDGTTGVVLSNPKSTDYQMVRTSLLPGLLNSLKNNIKIGIPLKIFEISDIVRLDNKSDVGASNHRFISAMYCSSKGELEIIHGLLDRIMQSLSITD